MPFRDDSVDHSGRRRFVFIVIVLAIFFVVVAGFIINYLDFRSDQERARCEQIRGSRVDGRARWDRLADQLEPLVSDDSFVIQMRADTDELLPLFKPCDETDNVPTPAYPPDPD